MTCSNCEIKEPGQMIIADDNNCCINCGRDLDSFFTVFTPKSTDQWDRYFYSICLAVATKSPCLSRKIGTILVRDNSIISTGYNGPPRGVPHCGHERFMKDVVLSNHVKHVGLKEGTFGEAKRFYNECPRRVLGYESGTHMELCPAQHAEENAVSNAARNGVSTIDCTLYMNAPIPCSKCFGTLINAGIKEIVIKENKCYDEQSRFIIDNSNITIREFQLRGIENEKRTEE